MFWIEIGDFEAICFNFGLELFGSFEPIPSFETRYTGTLESCLDTPRQEAFGGDLYPKFTDKLAILFYLMIKNHPFVNGNKRMAVATLLITLYANDKWITATPKDIYNLAVEVSESKPKDMSTVLIKIKKFLKEKMIDRSIFDKWIEKFKR